MIFRTLYSLLVYHGIDKIMASTVQDVYNIVSEVMLEPYRDGTGPGLSLGDFTLTSFLEVVSNVIEEFVLRTGLVWDIFTQQVVFGTTTYVTPNIFDDLKVTFLGGVWLDHETLQGLDDFAYNWRYINGTPAFWHEDGLPPKTLELVPNPNYSGASYQLPNVSDPTQQPPFGVYGLFNGATTGQFTGTVNTATLAVSWVSGATFDLNWNNYYPRPNITIAGTVYPIDTVTDSYNLTLLVSAGTQSSVASRVNIGNDGNLTMVGTMGPPQITYTLSTPIPSSVPDSAVCYLAYGVLSRIFSSDSEVKDMQRAYYCLARYSEGVNVLAGISGEMLLGSGK